MKRVSEILIGSTYTTTMLPSGFDADPTLLTTATNGDITLIDVDTQALATGASNRVQFIRKCSEVTSGRAFLEISDIIHRGQVTSYARSSYAAPTPKIQTLDLTGLTVTADVEYVIYIANKENFNYFLPRRRFGITAETGETVDTLGAKFVTMINESTSYSGVTASYDAGTDVLTFTGTATSFNPAHEVIFEVIAADNLSEVSGTLTTTQNPDKGCGTFGEIRKLEDISKGYRGYLNRVMFSTQMQEVVYNSAPGTNYDMIVIEHKQPQHTNIEGDVHAEVVTVIAAPTAGILGNAQPFLALIETTVDLDGATWK